MLPSLRLLPLPCCDSACISQAVRSAYGDAAEGGNTGIRVLLDTNVIMLKENPYDAVVAERYTSHMCMRACAPPGMGMEVLCMSSWRIMVHLY